MLLKTSKMAAFPAKPDPVFAALDGFWGTARVLSGLASIDSLKLPQEAFLLHKHKDVS